jgi:hypothetical protein
MPVPVVSPLIDGYKEQIKSIAGPNNVKEFASLIEFLQALDELKEQIPSKLGATK